MTNPNSNIARTPARCHVTPYVPRPPWPTRGAGGARGGVHHKAEGGKVHDPQGRGKNRRASVGGPLGRQKSPAQRMQPLLASHKPRAHEDASLGRLGETQRGSEDKGLSQTLGPKVRGGISIKEGDDKGDSERGNCLMPLVSVSGKGLGSPPSMRAIL